MTKLGISMFAALALTACGKKDHDGGKTGGDDKKPAGASASTGTPDAAAVNALVPAALKDKLEFEQRDLVIEMGRDKTTYTVAVPKHWTQDSKMFATLKPDDKGGFFSSMKIASDCDGECKPKAWEAIADKNFFAPRTKGKVIKDDKGPGKRTMISEMDSNGVKTTDVVVAWWTEGAKNYHACVAQLDDSTKDAAPAFEKACQAVTIVGDD
jgi:hypothetical protein